jgi:hypothetical protein
MQSPPRLHLAATLALLVACPLLSAVTIAGIAVGIGAALGASNLLVIGAVIAAAVFVANAAALCMAVTRREDDERTFAFEAVDAAETDGAALARARAS